MILQTTFDRNDLLPIKHSSSFTYSDFTPDFTSLSALPHIAAEQLHFLLVERWFQRKQVRRQGSASRHIVPCVPLQRFLGLNSKPCLAIAKDTVGYNRCFWQYSSLFIKVINSLHRFLSFKGCNQAHTTDFWLKLHKSLTFSPILCCSERATSFPGSSL